MMENEEPPAAAARRRGAFDYIDQARLGRTDWRSAGQGLLNLVAWQAALVIGAIAVAWFARRAGLSLRGDDPFVQILLLAITTLAWYAGLYGTVVAIQGRPFLSLLAVDQRLDLRRIGAGALLWIVSFFPAALLLAGFSDPAGPAAPSAPSAAPAPDLLLPGLLSLPIFPFQAAAEELVFRGWLTQTLGQFVRRAWLVAAIVALLFASAHFFAGGPVGFLVYMTMSLGFSAISLVDQRLELTIGLHATHNIFIILSSIAAGSQEGGHGLISYPDQLPWIALPTIATQYLLAYMLVRWTKAWPKAA